MLLSLVNDILDIKQLAEKKFRVIAEHFDLCEFAKYIIEIMEVQC